MRATKLTKSITDDGTMQYEHVDHPPHYNRYSVEVIEMLRRIYGAEETALFCEMTAFVYRMRMGTKPDNPFEQELAKEEWNLAKAKELRDR